MPHLTVVIPAFNESARLPGTLVRLKEYFGAVEYDVEVLVVDDGSTDDTSQQIREEFREWPALRVVRHDPNRGKGYAVRHGVTEATGDFVLFYDADGSTPIDQVEKFWPLFDAGADVAIGSRSLRESDVRVHQPWYRENMGRVFNTFVQLLVMRGLIDTQCGFKAFRSECARRVFARQRLSGFAFDVELLFIAKKLGYLIREAPVVWINSPSSRVNPIWDSARMLVDLVRIRWMHARGRYRLRGGTP